ncbi:MAG: GntR family transcriptional regulator [Anaerovoracaceae bacterium]
MPITLKHGRKKRDTSVSLASDLFLRIKEDILSGKLKSGQKLTEQAICDEYKVSRTPVREALVQLEMEGLIEIIQNRGAFVLGLTSQDLEDMFTLRKIYEVQATRWAIERMTEDELDAFEEVFEFMEFYTMRKDVNKMLNFNLTFHQHIYHATHNRMLTNLLSTYQEYLKHRKGEATKRQSYLDEVLEEHRAIFLAFKNRDIAAGAKAMSLHMDNSKKRHSK